MPQNPHLTRMASKTRQPRGWAREKVGRQIIAREFLSRKEMKEALQAFEDHRGIMRPMAYAKIKSVNDT